ncbi:DUF2946 family protein [Sagittula stellata]|uniref:Uncharacterized protein n=1 Tax=Sagittula stellata (strain ATCC 700073 / DSM 11524 / E-37) TaxID=388399 RepID=A3K4W1_SAGS3|nr:DUF2946 family protein [Sagittula stellata]EBA08010.1 hypothetical protein SSE37_02115 [Sagittula stellata E-37]
MPFLRTITRALLLLGLIGTSVVPTGFMRVSGPEGIRLVICTGDGPQEITVDASGAPIPDDDTGDAPDEDHRSASCILSGLVPTLVPDLTVVRLKGAAHRVNLWRREHQILARGPPLRIAAARAPPRPV